jgi:circadian clock protein KaiC
MPIISQEVAPTGIAGLDSILGGGFPRHRFYLIEGEPGTGKTTLALQFLLDGVARGESVLYVTLSETAEELHAIAASHGWSLDGITLTELTTPADDLEPEAQYTLFHPAEIELGETTRTVLEQVRAVRPARLVFDSLSEMRLLARDPLRYRRQILALKQFFAGRACTVLLLDQAHSEVDSIVTGVMTLEQHTPAYGGARRRLRVSKMRGMPLAGGYHDFSIRTGGIVVYPRVTGGDGPYPLHTPVPSGVEEIDRLVGGGLDRGTSVLIMGPSGAGKSTLATQYVLSSLNRGENAAMFVFDERLSTFFARSSGLGLDLRRHADSGRLTVQQVDPAELSPGEFAQVVREAVEQRRARMVVIDSLNGYLNAMFADQFLPVQLHELLTYLAHHGVLTILVVAQRGLVGPDIDAPVDVSYLADTVILLRYFESGGAVRQAVSVLKKRSGAHERTIRELRLGPSGVRVGEPLIEFHGVLTGLPEYRGALAPLLTERHDGISRSAD